MNGRGAYLTVLQSPQTVGHDDRLVGREQQANEIARHVSYVGVKPQNPLEIDTGPGDEAQRSGQQSVTYQCNVLSARQLPIAVMSRITLLVPCLARQTH